MRVTKKVIAKDLEMVLETDILIAHIHLILTMTRIVKDVQITISAVIVLDSSMG